MLSIPQLILAQCYAVFRRIAPRSVAARNATPVYMIGARDGVRLQFTHANVAVEYHFPADAPPGSFCVPLAALKECGGPGGTGVEFRQQENGIVTGSWRRKDQNQHHPFAVDAAPPQQFPDWPRRESKNTKRILEAFKEAMEIPIGGPGRLSLNCIQLRGKQGDIVATDGKQLLIESGFEFPRNTDILIPQNQIFASQELANFEVVSVALSKSHVQVRAGPWTVALPIESAARYPNVDQVIPNAEHAVTTWHIDPEDAQALPDLLDRLPAADEDNSPVTIDLAERIAIRAKSELDRHCTEALLLKSARSGNPIRVAIDRRYLRKAVELGIRSFHLMSADKPVLCKNDGRTLVFVPLAPSCLLEPDSDARRLTCSNERSLKKEVCVAVKTSPRLPQRKKQNTRPIHSPRFIQRLIRGVRNLWEFFRRSRQ